MKKMQRPSNDEAAPALSDAVLKRIFALVPSDHRRQLPAVCRNWALLCQNGELWGHVHVGGGGRGAPGLAAVQGASGARNARVRPWRARDGQGRVQDVSAPPPPGSSHSNTAQQLPLPQVALDAEFLQHVDVGAMYGWFLRRGAAVRQVRARAAAIPHRVEARGR